MPVPLPAVPARALTTAALCEAAGVTRGTLRVYERARLLEAPAPSAAGYRLYGAEATLRLAAIRQLKEVCFSLREIALLFAERDSLQAGIGPARLRRLAREQLLRIDESIARLQVVRDYVAAAAVGDFAALEDPACDLLVKFMAAAPPADHRRPASPAVRTANSPAQTKRRAAALQQE